jgi:hypothetical protein
MKIMNKSRNSKERAEKGDLIVTDKGNKYLVINLIDQGAKWVPICACRVLDLDKFFPFTIGNENEEICVGYKINNEETISYIVDKNKLELIINQ